MGQFTSDTITVFAVNVGTVVVYDGILKAPKIGGIEVPEALESTEAYR